MKPADHARARRQHRERFVRKRSESAARDIWTALVVKSPDPNWRKLLAILPGIRMPTCGCVQCAADAMTEQAEVDIMNRTGGSRAKKL